MCFSFKKNIDGGYEIRSLDLTFTKPNYKGMFYMARRTEGHVTKDIIRNGIAFFADRYDRCDLSAYEDDN